MTMRRSNQGFTLIELMIVVAIIAIIAAIAIPGLLRARISSNETSAIGTLKSLSTSQEQFKSQALVDQDTDGTGEYGLFQELAGTAACRVSAITANPTFMSANFGTTAAGGVNGEANKSGYNFLIYLPSSANAPQTEAVVLGVAVLLDANNQETNWVCYAWPTDLNTSGNRAFVVNQEGQVYQCPNTAGLYDGIAVVPPGDAAFSGATPGDMTGPIAVAGGPNAPSVDTETWTPVGG